MPSVPGETAIDGKLDPLIIAAALIKAMGDDNGCIFKTSEALLAQLALGVKRMQAAGIDFTEEQVNDLAAGEATEVAEQFGGVSGFLDVSEALSEIFNGSV